MLTIARDTITLLRFPFSILLAPVYLLALSQAPVIDTVAAIWTFTILHLLVYPASNGYNSYVDRDTASIGGLESPPQPTILLYYVTLALDFCAILLSALFVGFHFALLVIPYIIASRAYSSPGIRLKKYPFISFFTVVFFQGAYACYLSLSGIAGKPFLPDGALTLLLVACSFQIAGAYPLTQVYQHHQDREAGVETISMRLGVKGTFVFSALMFTGSGIIYSLYFTQRDLADHFVIVAACFVPVLVYSSVWFRQVLRDRSAADHKRTMIMSQLSAVVMIACFVTLFFLRK